MKDFRRDQIGNTMERRGFIKKGLEWLATLVGGAFLAYPAFSFMTFRKAGQKKIVFPADEQGGDVRFKEGVYLLHEPGGMVALSARCTHLGCTLNYDAASRKFKCPCHGSEFNISGERTAGPARENLAKVPLKKLANGDVEAVLKI